MGILTCVAGEEVGVGVVSSRRRHVHCSSSWWGPRCFFVIVICLTVVKVLGCLVIIVVGYCRVLVLVFIIAAYFVGGSNDLVTLHVYRDIEVRTCPPQVFRHPSSTLKPPCRELRASHSV